MDNTDSEVSGSSECSTCDISRRFTITYDAEFPDFELMVQKDDISLSWYACSLPFLAVVYQWKYASAALTLCSHVRVPYWTFGHEYSMFKSRRRWRLKVNAVKVFSIFVLFYLVTQTFLRKALVVELPAVAEFLYAGHSTRIHKNK